MSVYQLVRTIANCLTVQDQIKSMHLNLLQRRFIELVTVFTFVHASLSCIMFAFVIVHMCQAVVVDTCDNVDFIEAITESCPDCPGISIFKLW